MKQATFRTILEDCPIIAAVKDEEGLHKSLSGDNQIIFVLYGDICSIPNIVHEIKSAGRIAMVHMDLLGGISNKEVAVDYIHDTAGADGIISTKPALIKRAKELGMYTVLRIFLLDSLAYENLLKQCNLCKPDCIEVLPGVMPKVIERIRKDERTPIIAGGLISDKEDIMAALQAGAVSISTTRSTLWGI